MRRAMELARRGWGRVHPNPLVGAIVVRNGAVVGEGWHAEYGQAHAEVTALEAAGENARGGDLYVTLEPCAHHGKTPPCTAAILRAGIRRCVIAARDPNARAAGGADVLTRAGVIVEFANGAERLQARDLNAGFLHCHEHAVPFVALKLARSRDGAIARSPGAPTRITGPEAAAETHRLRAGFDAIAIGRGTVLSDDPLLTVRGSIVPRRPPVRVVLDTSARTPAHARIVRTARDVPTWILHGPTAGEEQLAVLRRAGVRTLGVEPANAGLDLGDALTRLGAEGIRTVFFEGGARLAERLYGEDRVHLLYLFEAPVILGAGALRALPTQPAADPSRWRLVDATRLGQDTLLVAHRRPERN